MAHQPTVAIRGCATSWRININYRFLKLFAPEVCGLVSDVSITSYKSLFMPRFMDVTLYLSEVSFLKLRDLSFTFDSPNTMAEQKREQTSFRL